MGAPPSLPSPVLGALSPLQAREWGRDMWDMWPCPVLPAIGRKDRGLPSVEGPWSARCCFSLLWPPFVSWRRTSCSHLQKQSPSAVLVQDGVLTSYQLVLFTEKCGNLDREEKLK